ncbi:hypothetical protein PROFUN_07303 [Planoprotostelium fungivorum]|uniref:TPR repeat-containing protein n=1 Tax=Planoprotostelium fungivorum TaxID=1890364 RepID=A0A2P6NM25_9EUKA|nr:hypothetical protein PROFUN_07303 [Planoprotostelium fungivorum]
MSSESMLWAHLCFTTGRVRGSHTADVLARYGRENGWKRAYYWLESPNLQNYDTPKHLADYLTPEDGDSPSMESRKKVYLLSRGLDIFPTSSLLCIQLADAMCELSDQYSWDKAQWLYRRAIHLCECEEKEKDSSEASSRSILTPLYRYAHFMSMRPSNYHEADRVYRRLLSLLPGNPWILERYAEFVVDCLQKYNLAEKIYRVILDSTPSGAALFSFAIFLWQVRGQYNLAMRCFELGVETDEERIYFFTNFIGRHYANEALAKQLLESSRLYQLVNGENANEQKIFALALAYHQIHCVDEAEALYRKHMKMVSHANVYTISNLAELLVHSRFNFEEAETLYRRALEAHGGCHETIEVALAGLLLAKGNQQEGLHYLRRLLSAIHIRSVRTTFTEGCILLCIHSPDKQERLDALRHIKIKLITERVRPKLILMFDANLKWAGANQDWLRVLTKVYNCEMALEELNDWDEWNDIVVDKTPEDEVVDYVQLQKLILYGLDSDSEENLTEDKTAEYIHMFME